MKEKLKGILIGFLLCAMLSGTIAIVANASTLYDVITSGVRIIIDGKELNATDANGNHVEPIIVNGTTYLPVRAIAGAFDKPVYWDGENFTVYLGNMTGNLEYPSLRLDEATDIAYKKPYKASGNGLLDNYDNKYTYAFYNNGDNSTQYESEYILNMKYTRFKGTLYIRKGDTDDGTGYVTITTDGKTVYTSPEMSKSSAPIPFDVSVKGCNDLKINWLDGNGRIAIAVGDAGFYQ